MFLRNLVNAFDLLGGNKRSRGIVHRNVLRALSLSRNLRKVIESGANGIVAMLAATHNRLNLLKALLADELLNVTMSIFARDDDDRRDGFGIFKRSDRMRDDRFPGNFGEELIETHATAAARRHDDSAKHGEDVEALQRCSVEALKRRLRF